MDNKELLELAALAAGVTGTYRALDSDFEGKFSEGISEHYGYKWWNPLEDDGDALRLAVKLRLLVECGYLTVNARYNCDEVEQWSLDDAGVTESVHGDIYAATRRAIVRAAAEIGKSMKVN